MKLRYEVLEKKEKPKTYSAPKVEQPEIFSPVMLDDEPTRDSIIEDTEMQSDEEPTAVTEMDIFETQILEDNL